MCHPVIDIALAHQYFKSVMNGADEYINTHTDDGGVVAVAMHLLRLF